MTDIYVSQTVFERIIKQGKNTGVIFESRGYLVTAVGSLTVIGKKRTPKKLFKRLSLPFTKIGYTGISSWTPEYVESDLLGEINESLELFDEEQLLKVTNYIRELKEK